MTVYRKVAILAVRLICLLWIVKGINEAFRDHSHRLLNAIDPRYAATHYARLDLVQDSSPLLMLIVPVAMWFLAGRLAAWTVKPIEVNALHESDRKA